jgi:hypothetical protein
MTDKKHLTEFHKVWEITMKSTVFSVSHLIIWRQPDVVEKINLEDVGNMFL